VLFEARFTHGWSDDRFIAKELSKAEVEAMATFVPAYFDYMSTAISSGVRSIGDMLDFFCLTFSTASDTSRKDFWLFPHQHPHA